MEMFSMILSSRMAAEAFSLFSVLLKWMRASARASMLAGESMTIPCLWFVNMSEAPLNSVVITGFSAVRASSMNLLAGS